MEVILESLMLGISSTLTDVTVTGPEETTLWAARVQIDDISEHFVGRYSTQTTAIRIDSNKLGHADFWKASDGDHYLRTKCTIMHSTDVIVVCFWWQPPVRTSFCIDDEHIEPTHK